MSTKQTSNRKMVTIAVNDFESERLEKLSDKLNVKKSAILLSGLYIPESQLIENIETLNKEKEDNRRNRLNLSSEEKEILQAIRNKKLSIKDIETL